MRPAGPSPDTEGNQGSKLLLCLRTACVAIHAPPKIGSLSCPNRPHALTEATSKRPTRLLTSQNVTWEVAHKELNCAKSKRGPTLQAHLNMHVPDKTYIHIQTMSEYASHTYIPCMYTYVQAMLRTCTLPCLSTHEHTDYI